MNSHGKLGIIIALSIAMVGATVAIAIPNIVEAAPPHKWCFTSGFITFFDVCDENGDPFNGKGECRKAEAAFTGEIHESCHKEPIE